MCKKVVGFGKKSKISVRNGGERGQHQASKVWREGAADNWIQIRTQKSDQSKGHLDYMGYKKGETSS